MQQMTPAAVERAMKLQDVMLRAMARVQPPFQRQSQRARDRVCAGAAEGAGLSILAATGAGGSPG
jgi:hypothetical protein